MKRPKSDDYISENDYGPSINDYLPSDFESYKEYEAWRRNAIAKLEAEITQLKADVRIYKRLWNYRKAVVKQAEAERDALVSLLDKITPDDWEYILDCLPSDWDVYHALRELATRKEIETDVPAK